MMTHNHLTPNLHRKQRAYVTRMSIITKVWDQSAIHFEYGDFHLIQFIDGKQ